MTVPFVDLFDVDYDENLHDVLRQARQQSWYATTPMGMIVLGYEDVQVFVRSPHLREMGVDALALAGITSGPLWDWSSRIIANQEGEAHTRLRRLVSKAFTPRQVDRLRPFMQASAHQQLDRFTRTTDGEFIAEFAALYPAMVIGELLGIPRDDFEQFQQWSGDLSLAFGSRIGEERPRIEAALVALSDYVDGLIATRRRTPGPDLLSALIGAEEAGERLDSDELQALVVVLIFGGQDTTQCQLGCALATFVDHPDQWARLATDDGVVATAVEEIIRYEPAGSGSPRVVLETFTHKGVTIAEGTAVLPSAPSANRDQSVFEDADRFDITRQTPHGPMTFGGGVHYCLGAALARAELQEALPILARRLPGLHRDGPIVWRRQALIRGPERLPIAFESTAA